MILQEKCCNAANYGESGGDPIHCHSLHVQPGRHGQEQRGLFCAGGGRSQRTLFVDETEIWSSVPEDCVAWHCGAKTYRHPDCRNANSIGVEICMNDGQGNVRQGSIDRAAQLVRLLMDKYHIAKENVLRHYDVTGKHCPGPMVDDPALWAAFQQSLTQMEDDSVRYKYYDDMPDWAKPTVSKLVKRAISRARVAAYLTSPRISSRCSW